MQRFVFDLEGNGLYPEIDTIWTLYLKDIDTKKWDRYVIGEDNARIKSILEYSDVLIGHNVINFDLPVLKKLWGLDYKGKVIDTIVMSRLWYPDLPSPPKWVGKPKPHSLEAWAVRIGGIQKVEQEQWLEFDPNMLKRCEVDVKITERVYNYLVMRMGL